MIHFLNILLRLRRKQVNLVVVDPSHPDETHHATFKPNSFLWSIFSAAIALVLVIGVLLYITPLGNAIYYKPDPSITGAINSLNNELISMREAVNQRDFELKKLKSIMVQNSDTLFSLDEKLIAIANNDQSYDSLFNEFDFNEQEEAVTQYDAEELNFNLTDESLVRLDALGMGNEQAVAFMMPLRGPVSRFFEEAKGHFGMDIAAEEGELVRSIATGTIIESQWTWNYGHMVVIQHKEGYLSVYKHLNFSAKRQGEFVDRGDVIGLTSNTGLITTGPHLHLEVWKNGIPLDPQLLIQ